MNQESKNVNFSECETTADALEDQLHVQISSRLGDSDSISSLSVTCSEKTTSIARKRRATTSYDATLNLEITTLVTTEDVTEESNDDSTEDSMDDSNETENTTDQSSDETDQSTGAADSKSDSLLSSVITDTNAISNLITESVADAVEESGAEDLAHLVIPTDGLEVNSVIAEAVTVVEETVTEEPVTQGTFFDKKS